MSFDLIVIGEGVGGLVCAASAANAGVKVATFESELYGGLVMNVQHLDGYAGAQSGTRLASELARASAAAGVTSVQEEVTGIRAEGQGFVLHAGDRTYDARQVVIASGARLKYLEVPGAIEFFGSGVSNCADCDGPLFRDEHVVVAGSGDSAFQEALSLARHCRTVSLLVRGKKWRARQHLVDRVLAEPKISICLNTAVTEIIGSTTVRGVKVLREGIAEEMACSGVFAYIGLAPNASFTPPGIARDATGRITTDEHLETTMPGVWAIGEVRSGYSGLLSDAAQEGRRVAESVASRLAQSSASFRPVAG